ncbi:transglutaminase-like cysteine peptidase [Aquipseudomonas ullengensis]|uniref:Transglutaminase-like cysteine peptidase n=1 Tax=Aquipseudomonas ullengensis TaxID=2759166 RepID=A0A7W4QAP2_9GAMM|nr:transglutaminase-like cysteine peptidase [Pseudomonas ullengensis]MBB2495660.1 transglutaminase-like cysteine peptidase [Pseudomonas ullengensis]
MPERSPHRVTPLRRALCSALGMLLFLGTGPSRAVEAPPSSALASALSQSRLEAWRGLLTQAGSSERERLEAVNRFINRSVQHGEDADIWGEADYWATPLETLSRGRGDCEDVAIAKYFSLVRLGVPSSKLRLTFVKALELNRAHMVLAYYAEDSAEPLILDNLQAQIRPASQRSDLLPVYAFNNLGIYLGSAPQRRSSQSPQLLSRWQDVSERALADGSQMPQPPQG